MREKENGETNPQIHELMNKHTKIMHKQPLKVYTVRLPFSIVETIDAIARKFGLNRTDLVKYALTDFLKDNAEELPPELKVAAKRRILEHYVDVIVNLRYVRHMTDKAVKMHMETEDSKFPEAVKTILLEYEKRIIEESNRFYQDELRKWAEKIESRKDQKSKRSN